MKLEQVLDLFYSHQKVQIIGRYWKSKITTPTDKEMIAETKVMHPNPRVSKIQIRDGIVLIKIKMTPRELVYGVDYHE